MVADVAATIVLSSPVDQINDTIFGVEGALKGFHISSQHMIDIDL